jgi:serine/threonine protein kinase
MEPFKIGRYQVTAEIGRGGMGTVYRAHDFRFDRDVAIKVLPREFLHDPDLTTRFYREAKIIGALEHIAIVPVHDFGEDDGQPYLVMRLMTGGSLEDKIHAGRIPLPEAARIFMRIAPALDRAHAQGVVHRDLKPSNILFDQQDEPYLNDFGIARLVHGATLTSQYATMGTPAYMSPEQGRGDPGVDGRSDIYALGSILFEMLSGRVPYESETPTGQIIKHINDPIPNILEVYPDLPADCQGLINRAMAKKKEDRYATVVELAQALSTISQGLPLSPPPIKTAVVETSSVLEQPRSTPSLPMLQRIWGRYPIGRWVLAGGCLLLCLLAGLGWLVFPSVFLKPKPSPTFTPTRYLTETFTVTSQPSVTELVLVVTRSPTFSSTLLPTPGSTLTIIPSDTPPPTPEATRTPTPLPIAIVKVISANVRTGPGLAYPAFDVCVLGTELQITGRNPEGTWLFILLPDQTQTGWIALSTVDIMVDVATLTIADIPPTPTLGPQPIPTSTRSRSNPAKTKAPYPHP